MVIRPFDRWYCVSRNRSMVEGDSYASPELAGAAAADELRAGAAWVTIIATTEDQKGEEKA